MDLETGKFRVSVATLVLQCVTLLFVTGGGIANYFLVNYFRTEESKANKSLSDELVRQSEDNRGLIRELARESSLKQEIATIDKDLKEIDAEVKKVKEGLAVTESRILVSQGLLQLCTDVVQGHLKWGAVRKTNGFGRSGRGRATRGSGSFMSF